MINQEIYNYETKVYKLQVVQEGKNIKNPCYQIVNKETGVVEYEGEIFVNTFKILKTLQSYHDMILKIMNDPELSRDNEIFTDIEMEEDLTELEEAQAASISIPKNMLN